MGKFKFKQIGLTGGDSGICQEKKLSLFSGQVCLQRCFRTCWALGGSNRGLWWKEECEFLSGLFRIWDLSCIDLSKLAQEPYSICMTMTSRSKWILQLVRLKVLHQLS